MLRAVTNLAVIICLLSASAVAEPRRVALVIGNSNYASQPLENPVHDAEAMAKTLAGLGFKVTKLHDVTKAQIEAAVDDVTDGLGKGDICLIFYAGHGLQLRAQNYLVPIGASIDRPQHVTERCVSVGYLLSALDFSGCSLKVIIVDACRTTPFRSFERNTSGLADLREAPEGTIVSFSTSPQTAALDGVGKNSPYVSSLLKVIQTRAEQANIVRIFIEASQVVRRSTGQKPYLEFDASMPDFFLKQAGTVTTVKPLPKTLPQRPVPQSQQPQTQMSQRPAQQPQKPRPQIPQWPYRGELTQSTWKVRDSDGETWTMAFAQDGMLLYDAGRGLRQNGKWTQSGSSITITINEGFASLQGTLSGSVIRGTGRSENRSPWSWTASPN